MGFYTFVCISNAFVFLKIVAACATPSINVVFGVPMPRLKEMIFDGNVMYKFDDFFATFFQTRPNDQNYEFEKSRKQFPRNRSLFSCFCHLQGAYIMHAKFP